MATNREEQDKIEALLLMGEYAAHQGYEDIFLCVQARIRKCKFEVEERHPYYLQTLFVHLMKVLKDVTYTNAETFEILLREFDMVFSCMQQLNIEPDSRQFKINRCNILLQMGIVKLRQLVCKDCGDLTPENDDIVETVGFQYNTYIESIEEIFSNNGSNQKENSDKSQDRVKKMLTDILTEVNVSKKSKKKQLDKTAVCDLLEDKKLEKFKRDLVGYIRDVRKTACRIPTIKGPDDGDRRAHEMQRDGKADWTNEQRSSAGFPQDPSMVLLGGKSTGKGSSSSSSSATAASGSSSKSRKVDELSPIAAASSGDGGASFSPGGIDDSGRQSKKSPVASKVTTAPGTKPSTYKPGDLKGTVANFNRTVKDIDPLKEINEAHDDDEEEEDDGHSFRETTRVNKKDSKINKKKEKTSSSSSSSSSSSTATKGHTRSSAAAAAAAAAASAQEDVQDDMDYGYNEVLTQAQMPEDDISEETKKHRQPPTVTKAGGRASGAKRARSPTKSSSSSSSSSSSAVADDIEEDIDDDDQDFLTDKFEHAKKQKLGGSGRSGGGQKVRGGGVGEKVVWDEQDEMAPKDGSAVKSGGSAAKSDLKNRFAAAKGSGAAVGGAGSNVRPYLGRKAPAAVGTKKNKWTEDEKETLLAAIRVHGVGNWQAMLDDPRFMSQLHGRTGVNLKDKHRTMVKNNEFP